MNTYIVLFRGINVGGNNLLPMKDLVAALNENNYQNVRTYIQSGNVLLQSRSNPEKSISSIVADKFGLKVEIFVLEASEFEYLVEKNPYRMAEGKAAHFYFCKNQPKLNKEKLDQLKSPTEEYHTVRNVFYLHAPDGIGRSKLVANIESCLGIPATGRNLNTVNKLHLLLKNSK